MMSAGGKMPEYTMLTPLALTPDVIPHDYEQLVNMGLAIPCDMVPHYSMMNLMPGLATASSDGDVLARRMPTSPEIDDDDEDDRDEESQDQYDLKDKDPFSPKCKIPLPTPFSPYEYWLEPSFIRRRNERERQRVRNVNDGFERLKNHLPMGDKDKDKRLSKVEILRMAIRYIRELQDMLKADTMDDSKENMSLLETLMKESIKKAMQCRSEKDTLEPVIAFSPARYVQLIAMTRHDNKEFTCGREPENDFHLNNPETWGFCVIGLCSREKCYCYQPFTGDKCEKFRGRCWLLYCRLDGCSRALTSLLCACHPDFYGIPVLSGEYWYDDGLSNAYLPPPTGWLDSVQTRTKMFYEYQGRFFVVGGNANQKHIPRFREKQPKISHGLGEDSYPAVMSGAKTQDTFGKHKNQDYFSKADFDVEKYVGNDPSLDRFHPQTDVPDSYSEWTVELPEYEADSFAEDDIEQIAGERKERESPETDEVFDEGDGDDVNLKDDDGELNQSSSTSKINFGVYLILAGHLAVFNS